ncbi:hypothetical protein N8I77_005558 [Diaporthe amygdali]|uniref:FAD-binding PCMH-type domain-containing protein n=1 Tax=Phomopsis amygdali TaxID=1214568 RepID=A0AAD9W2W0_PHOAM|nr:hypothetical protein N8I77_005558 [Diaporthe amygdali]
MAFQTPSNPKYLSSSQRLSKLAKVIHEDTNRNTEQLPGLSKLLNEYASSEIKTPPKEELIRRLIRVFKDSTTEPSYSRVLENYSTNEQKLINRFVVHGESACELGKDFHIGISPGAREELKNLDSQPDDFIEEGRFATKHLSHTGDFIHHIVDEVESVTNAVHSWIHPHPTFPVYDDPGNKHKVPAYFDKQFQNWGRTVENVPKITCVPTTSYGIQQVVRYAKTNSMNVRASGYRHSWSPIFGNQGQILISTLDLHQATVLPNIVSMPGSEVLDCPTELNAITFQGTPEARRNRLVRVGTAVTNQQLRRWCNSQHGRLASTLPLNVIMVEITLGGSNAPICHGAGRSHQTLSDLVHTIEYVDANGNIQKLSKDKEPDLMKAASGCFGLLGIITHITLEMIPMTYAVMRPQKLHITEAIPLPPGMTTENLPPVLRPDTPMTEEQHAKAQAAFEDRARNNFYAEWFWFPYTSKVWVNCWNTTDDPQGEIEYPSDQEVVIQWFQTVAAQALQVSSAIADLQHTFAWAQTTLMSTFALYAMPEVSDDEPGIKTQLPNALHFRRAIQNVRVLDTEMEIPLLPKSGVPLSEVNFKDEIDFTNVQRAWWAAVLTAYKPEHRDTCPQRMLLEMRITGPSQVIMAPFRGHNLGSASIEILTLENMRGKIWQDYAQEVLDHWMDLKDSRGDYLTTRPHWAKEWWNFKVRGQPMIDYVRQSYTYEIQEFIFRLGQIAKKHGWSMEDARKRFGNDALDALLQPVTTLNSGVKSSVDKQERSFITTTPVIIIN